MKILVWPGTSVAGGNPYIKLLYDPMRTAGHTVEDFRFLRALFRKYDILHFHWPEYYVAYCNLPKALVGSLAILLAMAWARLRGTKIVWTAHNLKSHHGPRPRAESLFWHAFVRNLDAFIAMTEFGCNEANEAFPHLRDCASFVIPHGHYRGEYPNHVSKREVRESLGIPLDAHVICFLGIISQYKGVPELISTFRQLADSNPRLVIAGECEVPEEAESLKLLAGADKRITLRLGFVPKEEVQHYLNAVDLAVMPFRKIWNSGSVMLALSFNCPVMVPAHGAFLEMQEKTGAEWIWTYRNELRVDDLKAALAWAITTPRSSSAPLERFEWKRIAEETLRSYSVLTKCNKARTAVPRFEESGQRTG
jgi:beta-1,4-mannosyltransferase